MEINEWYRDEITGRVTVIVPRLKLAAAYFVKEKCLNILDIGGNDGLFAKFVKDINRDVIIDIVDISNNLLSMAKEKCDNCYNFDVGKKWPLNNNSYDGIHLGAIIEHVFDYKTLFAETFRVVKPGGFIFISTPNMAYLKHRYQVLMGDMPHWYYNFGHIRMWTANYLKSELEKVGFKNIKTYGVWERIKPGVIRLFISKISSLLASILIAEATKPINKNII